MNHPACDFRIMRFFNLWCSHVDIYFSYVVISPFVLAARAFFFCVFISIVLDDLLSSNVVLKWKMRRLLFRVGVSGLDVAVLGCCGVGMMRWGVGVSRCWGVWICSLLLQAS
jgi:hypothetical protein